MTDAPAARDALSFRELMAYTGEETDRWEAWLRAHDPAVLDVALGEGRWGTVRELLFHTFLVERRYADRLLGDPVLRRRLGEAGRARALGRTWRDSALALFGQPGAAPSP